MKTYLYFFSFSLILIFLFTNKSFAQQKVYGNDIKTLKERSISSFSEIEITGFFKVELKQNNNCKLEIETDENLHKFIEVNVSNNTLIIDFDEDYKLGKNEEIKLYISFNKLESLEITGAAHLYNKSVMELDEFELDISGAAEVNLNLNANYMKSEINGAADLNFKGIVNKAKIEFNGAGNISAFDLITNIFIIELAGAGSAEIYVDKELYAEISGIGSIDYKGNPSKIIKDISLFGALSKCD